MKKIFILTLILLFLSAPCFSQQSIELKNTSKRLLLVRTESPIVYKPTRLVLGKQNSFTIKAEPGSHVSLGISFFDSGRSFQGKNLRLGSDMKNIEGIVPPKGFLRLNVNIPDDKSLIDSKVYFDAAVWKASDYSDIQVAKIISPCGRESESNFVVIVSPPEDPNIPAFTPTLPGASGEMLRVIESIDKDRSGDETEINNMPSFAPGIYQQPAMINNLRSPELIKK